MDHVLLEDDDTVEHRFADTNPFAPQNTSPKQADWKAKLGAFARKAGETVKQHATTAAAVAQVKLSEAKGTTIAFLLNLWLLRSVLSENVPSLFCTEFRVFFGRS